MRTVKNITEGNIYKNYFLYGLPLILSSIISSLYSTTDAVIAGKFISEHALGAISATASYELLFFSFFNGVSRGFSVYIAQLFGKGKFAELKRGILNMGSFVAGIALLASLLSIAFRSPILDYLNVDPLLRKDAETYFVIYTSSYLFSYVNLYLLSVLFALGTTSFSLLVTVISATVNIAGNLLTVLVLDLGVAGLALSTVVSTVVVTGIYVWLISKAFRELQCEPIRYRFSLRIVKESIAYTIPTAIQKIAFHATGILCAPAINGLGAAATTAYSVMSKMYYFCAQSFWNMSSALDCHTAHAAGAGDVKKVRRGLSVGLWTNVAVLTPFVILFIFLAEPIALIFFPGGFSGAALDDAVRFFKIYALFLYINMLGHLLHSYMRSIGRVLPVLWSTLFGSTTMVVTTLLLVPTLKIDGVYLGLVLSWIADALLSLLFYFSCYHRKEKLQRVIDAIAKKK